MLVIDEFAALAEELPAFVDGIVDLARRGRSLGIHLLLATQRPSGVVSPAIRTNTNLRLAMRVTDATDSVDVIDSPLAARIAKETPGRAFVRVGHEQLTEVQAARIGGRPPRAASAGALAVHELSWRTLARELTAGGARGAERGESDLAALVRAIGEAAALGGARRASGPWLAPLPELVLLEELLADEGAGVAGVAPVPFALEDRPLDQARGIATFDLAGVAHLLFVGDAGSGRTSALRSLGAAVALAASPADVHLYGIDAGNGGLLPLEDLPHCGAVVSRSAPERVERLLSKLHGELERRQQLLADGGFASIAEQRAAARASERLPYLVVLLDRFESFAATFDLLDSGRLVALLLQCMREASGTGLRFVLTGDRSALSGRLGSLVENVVLLRLNDRSAYALAGLSPRTLPDRIAPGRGFVLQGGTELQIALLDPDPSGAAQVLALQSMAKAIAASASDVDPALLPDPIGVLPRRVRLAHLAAELERPRAGGLVALLGIGGDRLGPEYLDLAALGGFLVAGPPRSGRSNALVVLARSILLQGGRVCALTARPSPLARLAGIPGVVGVFDGRSAGAELAAALAEESSRQRLAVLVDDAELIADPSVHETLTAFARRARDHASTLVAAGTTSELATALRGVVPELRKARCGLLLCPHGPADGELVGIRLPRTLCFPDPAGRAVLVGRGPAHLVQVPLDDAAATPAP